MTFKSAVTTAAGSTNMAELVHVSVDQLRLAVTIQISFIHLKF